ncbi:hypothetical protein HVA01_19310 [Halovibrio variabilis]|uniref:Uncharacterized protein n=2 Tax=Halovibrio variabilis TaxID=31910 RepID=A0A511UNU8_9GAMM|nr:hypothetical protein HVA01_19310 [Halovibrio variabilis]
MDFRILSTSLVEDKDMLAENLEKLVKKGRLEVRQEEAQRILRKQLGLKFGELPIWVEQRLGQATPA